MAMYLLAAALVLFVLVGAFCGFLALILLRDLREQSNRIRRRLDGLADRLGNLEVKTSLDRPGQEETLPEAPAEGSPYGQWQRAVRARRFDTIPAAVSRPPGPEMPTESEPVPDSGPLPEEASPTVDEDVEQEREPAEGPGAGVPATTEAPTSEAEDEPLLETVASVKTKDSGSPAGRGQADWVEHFEEIVGKRWTVWVGVLVLFAGMGFFVKYAFEKRWIGPGMRVVVGALLGIALLAAGHRFIRKKMRALGQGLIGGGMAVTYVSLFAAFTLYHLIPQTTAFLAMAATTAVGMTLAVVHDALPVSVLAVLGGFITPILLRTGTDPRDALFGYLVVLDLGVLGVAFFKRWRALDVLTFAGTAALYAAWFFRFYTTPALLPAMLWLGAVYAVFLVLPFVFHLRHRTPLTVERFGLALAASAFFTGYAYRMLRADSPHVLGFIVLALAACYAAFGVLTRRRVPEDRRAHFGFITLAMVFLTLSAPLHFGLDGITLSWTGEAVALVCLGYLYGYGPVRLGGFAVLALALFRVFAFHLPEARHDAAFDLILNRPFLMLLCAPLGAAACSAAHFAWRKEAKPADVFVRRLLAVGAGLMLLTFLHIELEQWLALRAAGEGVDPDYLKWCSLTILWAVGACVFLVGGLPPRHWVFRLAGALPLCIAIGLAVYQYARPDGMSHPYVLAVNARFMAAAIACAVLFGFGFAFRDRDWRVGTLTFSAYALLGLLHTESHFWLHARAAGWDVDFAYLSSWWMTMLWAVGACGFLVVCRLRKSETALRAGLIPVLVAVGFAVRLYVLKAPEGYALFLNARFFTSALACAVAYAFAFSSTSDLRGAAATVVGFASLILLHAELETWMGLRLHGDTDYVLRITLALLWSAGSLAMLGAGIAGSSAFARNGSAVALIVAAVYVFRLYGITLPNCLPALNGRFLTGLAACAVLGGHVGLRKPDRISEDERSLRAALFWCALLAFLVLFSAEPYAWIKANVQDPSRARWQAQMSVSIVWGLYATGLLALGFWRNVRPIRLAALALFGVTVLKLVLVDMANVEQIYRIVSFIALGMLMIGASYLYHKVEKHLMDPHADEGME